MEISRGYETVGVRQDSAGVAVEARGAGYRTETLRARYAAGCDGGRSVVRQAAGIGFRGTDETLTGVLGDFARMDPQPGALDDARARGVIIAPLDEGLTRIVYLDPERMRVPSLEPVTLGVPHVPDPHRRLRLRHR